MVFKVAIKYQKWDVTFYILERWGPLAHPAQAPDPFNSLHDAHGPWKIRSRIPHYDTLTYKVLKTLELLLSHGMIDSFPRYAMWAPPADVLYDILKLILSHPKGLPRDEITNEDIIFLVFFSTFHYLGANGGSSLFTENDAQSFESLIHLLGLDVNAQYRFKHTLLHKLMFSTFFVEVVITSQLRSLLLLGANPCLLNDRNESPMLLALGRGWHVLWCRILAETGFNVNAIAKHTYKTCASAGERLHGLFHKVSRPEMLRLFAEASIYPEMSWFEDDDDNIYSLETSGVDFIPATVHDESRDTKGMKQRTARTFRDE